MKRNHRKAFTELKKMGCPVFVGVDNKESFFISAEDNEHDIWADYHMYAYGEFGVKQSVCDKLREHGLYAEWINPGLVSVNDI
tara:strand:- start:537 stop:785 length:249 start_codon:yes stop_codon:yes gene_type:complete